MGHVVGARYRREHSKVLRTESRDIRVKAQGDVDGYNEEKLCVALSHFVAQAHRMELAQLVNPCSQITKIQINHEKLKSHSKKKESYLVKIALFKRANLVIILKMILEQRRHTSSSFE